LLNNEEYFSFLEREVNDVLKYQGRLVQSLEESSFDTWIKHYRKDENYKNAQISYYTKGALVALMLNLEIINSTSGKHSLDDVIKNLYEDYKHNKSSGFQAERIKEISENISGLNLDDFWERYVRGTYELPLNSYFEYAGLEIVDINAEEYISFDIETVVKNNKLMISKVYSGGSGYESGLNANDEIILLNRKLISNEGYEKRLQDFNKGDVINVSVIRNGSLLNVDVRLLPTLPNYKIISSKDKTESQVKHLNKWLKG
jgi:predicted metalloprotease with PDZ domain